MVFLFWSFWSIFVLMRPIVLTTLWLNKHCLTFESHINQSVSISFRTGGRGGGRGGGVARSGSDIKDMLLRWSRAKTKEYEVFLLETMCIY